MLIEDGPLTIVITGDGYQLVVPRDRPLVELSLNGRPTATLNIASGLDTTETVDAETILDPPQVHGEAGTVVLVWAGRSTCWQQKTVELRAEAGGFSYGYSVHGHGRIDRAHLFRTHNTSSLAPGIRLFNPEPNSGAVRYTGDRCTPGKHCRMCLPNPESGRIDYVGPPDVMTISLSREKEYHEGNWFFTPAPFCYAVEGAGNWLGFGLAALPGEWTFAEMEYPGEGLGFSLHYEGHTVVDGVWRSPRLVCLTAPNEYAAIDRYCDKLRSDALVPSEGRGQAQAWWREPMFCGWGEQVSQSSHWGRPNPCAWATQANYERWLVGLEARAIDPGTVVIDDKWQSHYGLNDVDTAKWPDLPGFIADQHRQGRHVLVWLKAWDPEGVPPAECICNGAGMPITVDPGDPAFAARLREQVRHMLVDLGADGFKIDFTHLIPRGPRMSEMGRLPEWSCAQGFIFDDIHPRYPPIAPSDGGLWGLELLRQWLQIVSEAAAAAKPDALIITHTANPYLANLVDMLRLNDVAGLVDIFAPIVPDMEHRFRIARAASPYWLIDSDNWPTLTRVQWRDYIKAQGTGEVGVPALYHAERLAWGPTDEPLEEEDYEAIRRAWGAYRCRLAKMQHSVASAPEPATWPNTPQPPATLGRAPDRSAARWSL